MKLVVVGSGPSGLHFAQTALERGQAVTLIDLGNSGPCPPLKTSAYAALKSTLPDPVSYFLGESYDGAEIPAAPGMPPSAYYKMPPSKAHVFARPSQFSLKEDGLHPLISFAAGGLAECWTAGAYTFDDDDLAEYPFGNAELAPYYAKVAQRIGVAGRADDLSGFLPVHEQLAEPIALNDASAALLAKYERKRHRLHSRHKVRLGRSRQAALSVALGTREGCTRCGRCLWGCPNGALYTPAQTLADCLANPLFTYVPGRYVSHFELADDQQIAAVVSYPAAGGAAERQGADSFVLACGTLNSSAIHLRTIWHARGETPRLGGLMDNRQVLAPFYNPGMLGRAHNPASYQYHQLAVGLPTDGQGHYVHGQITMFTNGAVHPVIQQLPLGLRTSRQVFAALRSGLGVLNLNFHDTRREGNYVTLDPDETDATGAPVLKLYYRPTEDEPERIASAMTAMRRFFRDLGTPLIPGMARIRPMGAGVHYAGTLPMSATVQANAVNAFGQSYDHPNLWVVDGAALPALPAKNLTFTLMTLATRAASKMF